MRAHSTLSGGLATLDMLDGLPQELAFRVEEFEARLAPAFRAGRGSGPSPHTTGRECRTWLWTS